MVTLRQQEPMQRSPVPAALPFSDRHRLTWAIGLHLAPGAIFTLFLVAATSALVSWDIDPSFALFAGIGLVIAPLELGYLAYYARRTTGSWSPLNAVTYKERLPGRRLVRLAAGLVVWFYAVLIVSMVFIDKPLATNVFAWMPEALLQATGMKEAANTASGGAVVLMLLIAVAFNGIVGPITEELYFRGHLLPRLDRYGRWAPVINTVLFAIYHFFSPWRYPAIILGFLPIAWITWRTRSVYLSIVAHMVINMITVLLLFAMFLQ